MSTKTHRELGGASLTFCPISFDGIHKSRMSNAQRFYSEKACNQSAILLLTHNAAGYYGSEWRALVSVRIIGRESLHTSNTLCPVCYKKMASNSMAGPLGRKLFCRFLGANRYMLPLNSNLYTFIKYVMSGWYAFCLITSRKQLWWTIGAKYTSGKFLFKILK